MYEISLVPNVKGELLRKQKLRNLIVFLCIGIGIACGAIVMILSGIMAGQALTISDNEKNIACRYDGKVDGNCDTKKYGTPILKFNNLETLLTIQDQLKNIDILDKEKIKFSRIFGLLDVLLIEEERGEVVKATELNTDFSSNTISFDALGYDYSGTNIGYKPLETFRKNALKMYYDFGDYMRLDEESGNYEVIPEYCIDETIVNETVYGIYHKGAAGCEAPMVSSEETGIDIDSVDDDEDDEDEDESEKEKTTVERKDIYIRRTYRTDTELEKTKNGTINDSYLPPDAIIEKGYYFDSQCIVMKDNEEGKVNKDKNVIQVIDEDTTLENCPVVADQDDLVIMNSSYGKDNNEEMVLSFSTSITLSSEIFLARNHNMQIIGPTRQNVTDSYVQIRNMFSSGQLTEVGEN